MIETYKSRVSAIAGHLKHWLVTFLLFATPRRPYMAIFGYPDTEGNATEMVRASIARYRGRIYLLAENPAVAREVLKAAGIDEPSNLTVLPHRSIAALFRFVTAEVSMFTHGVFGAPRRVPRKTLVNLWHGGGIKAGLMSDHRGRPTVHSDYLLAATRRQGLIMAKHCRLPDAGLLLTGNPRVDQFEHYDFARIAQLGIDPDSPFVLWMPTFRRSTRQATQAGTDVGSGKAQAVNSFAQTVVTELSKFGIQTVVKPHPSDAEHHAIDGAIIVTNETLLQHKVLLYNLIGASSGLLTDYSSVWIDYLLLDRPIAFLVPDEESYKTQRGFEPADALDWLPGPRINSTADILGFAEDVESKGALTARRRKEVAEHIGLVAASHVADRVLDELASHGVFSSALSTASPPTNRGSLP
ncbi:CDP-glycerol glycerophosphotransferase family protein [Mycolicibacterium phlei]|uniref:CDP-glycerol glycerophosphotransferase family protein n=1 Tax=Mycolicibacterium phlei TaxID=1771 RepID=UPI0009DA474F|nr:CDP-glycerol glycerophosphotransferase family protein [Mycolicibacterium phlei]